jgi:hypothetical protein
MGQPRLASAHERICDVRTRAIGASSIATIVRGVFMRLSSRQHLAAIIAALGLLTALVSPAAAAEPLITPIAGGLNAPRHLDIAPNGAIYVTESGVGGDECIEPAPDTSACFGTTGSVTRIWKGSQSRIATGLPSLALSGETGNDLIGPAGISVHGNGNIMVSLGEPDYRDLFANSAARDLGWLIKINPSGNWKTIADIGGYEFANDPDGQGVDPNPFGVAVSGNGAAVTDAGGNTLLWADRNGSVSLLATFGPAWTAPPFPGAPDPFPAQAVPTSVTVGPDGAWYVGLLTGYPFQPGVSSIYRVVRGEAPTVYATGLTNVIGVDFAPDGTLYAVEIAQNGLLAGLDGAVMAVAPGGGVAQPVVTDGLFAPGGIAVAADGSMYVTTCSVCAGGGGVVHIQL